jgi:hypothetical protein
MFITETAVAYSVFKSASFDVSFATESGNAPKCDDKMLYGVTGKLLVRKHLFLTSPTYKIFPNSRCQVVCWLKNFRTLGSLPY